MFCLQHRAEGWARINARRQVKHEQACACCGLVLASTEAGMGFWMCIRCRVLEKAELG